MEISSDISDYWETNTGILGLLCECLLAETLGWLKHRTLGLSQVGGTRKTTLRWHLVVGASCFCTVHERTGGDGGWDGGERKEKAVRTKVGFFVLGPVMTFFRFFGV